MKGKILDYNISESLGLISGSDGKRYTFENSQWKATTAPAQNQTVDFEVNGDTAVSIYLDSTSSVLNTENVKQTISDIQNTDIVKKMKKVISKALNEGIQNRLGVIVSTILLISLFLPVLRTPLGGINLFNLGLGSILFIIMASQIAFFFIGVKHQWIKLLTAIVSFIVVIQLFRLFTGMANVISMFNIDRGSINVFPLISYGFFMVIASTIVLLIISFKSRYKENNPFNV